MLAKLIVKCLPCITKYIHIDGSLYCKLLKALYGCMQASKNWFEKLTKFLCSIGYEHSIFDMCIMHCIVDRMVSIIIIYVDDILVIACQQELNHIRELFIKEFRWITMEISNQFSYLEMLFMICDGFFTVDMFGS